MKEKGQPRSEVATYQYVHFTGNMTIFDEEDGNNKNPKSSKFLFYLDNKFVLIITELECFLIFTHLLLYMI